MLWPIAFEFIEAYFRNDPDVLIKNPDPFQIYHYWFKSYSRDEPIFDYERISRPKSHSVRLRKVAFQRFVYLPYVPILVLCGASFVILFIWR